MIKIKMTNYKLFKKEKIKLNEFYYKLLYFYIG